jgi:hypothetical protein
MPNPAASFQHKAAVDGKRLIDRLKGNGVATTGRGKEISVRYHLSLSQDQLDCDRGDLPEFGAKTVAGQVWCPHDGSFVAVHQGQVMTLLMEDGRKLRFVHSNRDGGITVTQWIG